ncbi:unnamed protein product, partial [Urochloa humidicola]
LAPHSRLAAPRLAPNAAASPSQNPNPSPPPCCHRLLLLRSPPPPSARRSNLLLIAYHSLAGIASSSSRAPPVSPPPESHPRHLLSRRDTGGAGFGRGGGGEVGRRHRKDDLAPPWHSLPPSWRLPRVEPAPVPASKAPMMRRAAPDPECLRAFHRREVFPEPTKFRDAAGGTGGGNHGEIVQRLDNQHCHSRRRIAPSPDQMKFV